MKIAISVLNFNGLKDTIECLQSLKNLKKGKLLVEIIVSDNNSHDGSQSALSKIKDITLIQNTENLGFAQGHNQAIKLALDKGANSVLILNNDTIAHNNLLNYLSQDLKQADIICPKIYFAKGFEFHKDRYKNKDRGKVIWYAGAKVDWDNAIGIHTGVNEIDIGQFSKSFQIDFATGACMLIKKEIFEKVGFFDERYFLYLEDMDFSIRAKNKGFKILFDPRAIIWHKNASSSGGPGSKLQDYYISRNRLLFAFKFAKLRTKIAVFKQILMQLKEPIKRQALRDFLLNRFGQAPFY